jgi:hypothetical protein
MKKTLFAAIIVALFTSCERNVPVTTYTTGKNLDVAGRAYNTVRDTFIFCTDGTFLHHTDFGGYKEGTYVQDHEIVKAQSLYSYSPYEEPSLIDILFISYGDFIVLDGRIFYETTAEQLP